GRVAPVFLVSNVTGEGLDLLKSFINMLPPRIDWSERQGGKLLCYIDEKFDVTGVGLVVAGLIESGSITSGERVLLGPFDDGSFRTVRVRSIHVNRLPVDRAVAGQMAGLALSNVEYDEVRRGMVLLDLNEKPRAVREFEARIRVLHHPTTIKPGYEPVIQLKTIRQSAKLVSCTKGILRSGDVDTAVFRFKIRPEYITVGDVFFFREGRTKGMGRITRLIA
ncbi:MAG TPA: elongation factor 1-alpha, partial [Candidatus Korarchaeota archaeon]|nr:elongation factor 1-alpha [Candidatus Korarchaeota archaeon]